MIQVYPSSPSPRIPTLLGILLLAALLFLLLWVATASAGPWGSSGGRSGCSGGSCGTPVQAPAPDTWEWRTLGDDDYALLRNGVQCGAYRIHDDAFRPYDAARNKWGAFMECPVKLPPLTARQHKAPPCGKAGCGCGCDQGPCDCVPEKIGVLPTQDLPEWMTQGVNTASLSHREKVTVCGREVSMSAAFEALGASSATLPDDANKPWLIAVFDAATLAKVKTDVAAVPALSAFRQQFYDPADAMIRDRDGKVLYTPGLWFVRASDSAALSYSAEYPGPEKLAQVGAEALRRADPAWDPKKVPDLSKPPPPPPPAPTIPATTPAGPPNSQPQSAANLAPGLALGASAVALLWALTRKKTQA